MSGGDHSASALGWGEGFASFLDLINLTRALLCQKRFLKASNIEGPTWMVNIWVSFG